MPDSSNQLKFDQQGERVGKIREGLWATDAMVQVESLKVRGRELQIAGKRVANYFDPDKGSFQRRLTMSDVRIQVDLPDRSVTAEQLMPVLTKIFLTGSQTLADVAPDYWKACLEGQIINHICHDKTTELFRNKADLAPRELPRFGLVYKVGFEVDGAKVSAPKALSMPDPKYPEIARQAKLQGTTVLWLIVDRDGVPKHISVVRPLGLGLDDAAVRTVEKWRFKPAMKGSEPVPVQINVEVNFRLY